MPLQFRIRHSWPLSTGHQDNKTVGGRNVGLSLLYTKRGACIFKYNAVPSSRPCLHLMSSRPNKATTRQIFALRYRNTLLQLQGAIILRAKISKFHRAILVLNALNGLWRHLHPLSIGKLRLGRGRQRSCLIERYFIPKKHITLSCQQYAAATELLHSITCLRPSQPGFGQPHFFITSHLIGRHWYGRTPLFHLFGQFLSIDYISLILLIGGNVFF